MSQFKIWCRTAELAPDRHLVTVALIPVQGKADEPASRTSETRVMPTAESATRECTRLIAHLRERMAALGHDVVEIQSV